MATLLIELTNRCNLNCRHCYHNRHGGHDEIPLPVMEKIIGQAAASGFDTLVFTGGEPTLHSQFAQIVRRVHEAGYHFGWVSNGQNFPAVYPWLLPFVDRLTAVTFSLEGATAISHDGLRGFGTFVNLLKAVSICMARDIPFTFNTVLTTRTVHELQPLTDFAWQLGSRGIRFGHLMLTPAAIDHGLAIAPDEIKAAGAEVEALNNNTPLSVGQGPGFYTTSLFPCAALQLAELTIDCSSRMALCCHLPDHGAGLLQDDPRLDLNSVAFEDAYDTWKTRVQCFRSEKETYFQTNGGSTTAHLPCWFCHTYSGQLEWLKNHAVAPWSNFVDMHNFSGRLRND